jgi:hypothetical protein
VDNELLLFPAWATLPHRGTGHRTGWVSRTRTRWVRCALDDVVQGAGGTGVVGHAGSLA